MRYHVPRKVGNAWVDADQILPLLDGLDEVAKEARHACVQQINSYYQSRLEHGSSPLVVCCRSEEYNALSTRVLLQHAVSILPLTDEQINSYLEQSEKQIKTLRNVLDEDAELRKLAHQPLMLTIFTFAYQGAAEVEAPSNVTHEKAQNILFARYVEHMLKRREQSKHWKPEQVIHRLTFLASQMQRHDQAVFSVENLQPGWLSKKWKILYQLCLGLVFWLIFGLVFWLFSPVGGLIGGLILAVMQIFLLNTLIAVRIIPAETFTWSWEEVQQGLVVGVLTGLVVMLILVVLIGWLFSEMLSGLLVGLFLALTIVLASAPFVMLSGRQLSDRHTLFSNEGIWRSGKNGLVFMLVSWLFFILVIGLFYALPYWLFSTPFILFAGPFYGIAAIMFLGFIIALFVSPLLGLGAFLMHFILRFFLSWSGDLPYNLVPFLDEMAERLLLRKVGGSYIFVHRLLMDYFADLEEEDV